MSALVGIYYLDGRPVDHADLGRMTASVAHRGPDGSGTWNEGPIGLGHRLLWTTPESLQERLPLWSQTKELVLTADARIDNRAELIAILGFNDRPHREINDGELILAAYEKWGEACPGKLFGDFAFAIWDRRKQWLFCARDYFGLKPFYYYHQPGRAFIFGSEIKALLCLPEVPRRLNEAEVADYLASLGADTAITFYQEIFRLPPATSLIVDREGLRLQQYWSLDPTYEIRYGSDDQYAEAFREMFIEAVRCRVRSAFPVGSSLSGGLDSSSVVCVARQLLAESGYPSLHTFSAVFDEVPVCDERPFINTVLAQGGVEPHFIHLDRLSALTDIDRVLWHQDQPIYIRNMFLWTAKYEAAQRQGIRVMLDGEDGDTVVSHGDAYLIEIARAGRWAEFAKEAQALLPHFANYHDSPRWLLRYGYMYLWELARTGQWAAFVRAANEISRHFDISRWQLFLRQGLMPLTPEPVLRALSALRRRGRRPKQGSAGLINPSLAQRVNFAKQTKASTRYTPIRTLREAHWLGLTAGSTSWVYEELNKAAAAFAVEPRHPFYDRRLVEFCLALPPEQKLHRGWPRWIQRRAMANILPDEIRWRVGKSILGQNFDRSLLVFERERLEELIVKAPEVIAEHVDLPTLRRAYQRGISNAVWPAVILALWLRQTGLTT